MMQNQLDAFHTSWLRTICDMKLSDRVGNLNVLTKTNITGTEAIAMKIKLMWTVHLSRMCNCRFPK